MRTYTQTVREGELLGPVDYDYPFIRHFDGYSCSADQKAVMAKRCVDMLRKIEADPERFRVILAHSFTWKKVYAVGMYDGWPFWKPTPALLCSGPIGSEWHFFYDLNQMNVQELCVDSAPETKDLLSKQA